MIARRQKLSRLFTAAIPTLLLTACSMTPNYSRPDVAVPSAYRWQTGNGANSIADQGWWTLYQDPALKSLIETALAQNLDVRIAAARVEQARASAGDAVIGELPQLSVGANAGRAEASSYSTLPGAARIGNSFGVTAKLSYELDIWGRLHSASNAARADLLASQYAQQAVRIGLVSDVASNYFTLRSLDEQLAITRNTVESRQQFLDLTQEQGKRGVVSGLDVSTADAQLATAQANVPELQRQIALTETRLSLLLGKNPGEITRDAAQPLPTVIAPNVPAGLPSTLLERRPDLGQAEANLVAANARVGVAKAALFPSISLTGSFGALSPKLSDLFTGPAQLWSVGVGLLQPLIDADRNAYLVDLANAKKAEALLQYQKAVQTAFGEVADALAGQQRYEEFRVLQQRQVDSLRNASRIALMRYKAGYSSYFDVINADRDLFNAELALANAKRNSLTSAVLLYRALGGGWQVEETANAEASKQP
ncbi:MAG: efflux transporter outer membrane subunit [Pseudomonadota bacterium]